MKHFIYITLYTKRCEVALEVTEDKWQESKISTGAYTIYCCRKAARRRKEKLISFLDKLVF